MSERTARIAPLQPPYEASVESMLAKWMPPGSDAEPLRLFRTLAVHEQLMSRMRPLGAGILGASALVAPELREVLIHRTCALTGAQYEWGVHAVAFGAPLGLTPTQLHGTVHGDWRDQCWGHEQASVLRLADELHATSAISDELWQELAEHFEQAQLLELIVTAGWYHVIAYICNGLRVQEEEWAPAFPPALPPEAAPQADR
jgi:4-carboxymuconolactone decarboxylase